MSKKLIVLLLVVGVSFSIALVFGLSQFSSLAICHSPDISERITVADPTFSSDGKEVAFTAYLYRFRQAVGICTFPTGGIPLSVDRILGIYTMPTASGVPQLRLAMQIAQERDYANNPLGGDSHRILGWKDESIFFSLAFSKTDGNTERFSYEANLVNNTIEQMSAQEDVQIREEFWGQGRFSPIDQSLWVDFDYDVGIGLFRGEKYGLNFENKSVYQRGVSPTLEILLLDNEDIQQLSSSLVNF